MLFYSLLTKSGSCLLSISEVEGAIQHTSNKYTWDSSNYIFFEYKIMKYDSLSGNRLKGYDNCMFDNLKLMKELMTYSVGPDLYSAKEYESQFILPIFIY